MLIDRWIPTSHFDERHSVRIAAPPEEVFRAIKEVPGREIRLLRPLMALRSLGSRLLSGKDKLGARGTRPMLEEIVASKAFLVLGESPGLELVVGTIGKFWRIRGPGPLPVSTLEEFGAFSASNYAKVAMNFLVEPLEGGCQLVTETRIFVTSDSARRKFGFYWGVIRLGSGLIRRMLLGAIKRRAEHGPQLFLGAKGPVSSAGRGQSSGVRAKLHPRTKTTVGVLLAVVMLAVGCGGGDLPVNKQASPNNVEEGELSAAPESVPSAQGIRVCSDYDGASCSVPGSHFTCYNQYPYEPGICYCTNIYVWSCG